jgi:ATP-dependent protease ClpP protease subunit
LNTLLREAEEFCVISTLRLRVTSVIPIWLHIYSNGGYIHAALAAVDVIQNSRVPVYSVIEGATASAGTMISVVCKKRYIRKNAYMLIYQLSSECWGKMSEIEDEYKHLSSLMKHVASIYSENTNITEKRLKWLLQHDLWLDAAKCLKYHLVYDIYE